MLQGEGGEAGAARCQQPAQEGHRERWRREEEAEQAAEMEPTSIMPRNPGAAVRGGRGTAAAGQGAGESEDDGWAGNSVRGEAAAGSMAQRRQRGPAPVAVALSAGRSVPSTPGASPSRAFDEDDPVQVMSLPCPLPPASSVTLPAHTCLLPFPGC